MKYNIIIPFLLVASLVRAQEPSFSQFYAASIFINPALAGGESNIVSSLQQRTNINRANFPYNLSLISVVVPIRNVAKLSSRKFFRNGYTGGLGLTVYNETAGKSAIFGASGILGTYAYFTQVNLNNYMSMGAQIGVLNRRIDAANLQWGSQYDPITGYNSSIAPSVIFNNPSLWFPVANAGFMWYYNPFEFSLIPEKRISAFGGGAVSYLNRPDESFFGNNTKRIPMVFKLHGGLTWLYTHGWEFSPNVLFMMQNKQRQINTGFYVSKGFESEGKYYKTQVGAWYRVGDAFIFTIGFQVHRWAMAISYDLNSSSLGRYNEQNRSLEISLKFFIFKGKAEPMRNISRPLF